MKGKWRAPIALVLVVLSALAGISISGCSRSRAATAHMEQTVYVNLSEVAEKHPVWRQVVACRMVETGLLRRNHSSFFLKDVTTPANTVTDQLPNITDYSPRLAVRSAAEHEIEAFEKAERSVAQAWVEARRAELIQRWQSGCANAKRECEENLQRRLRAVSLDFAEKALPLRLEIQVLKSSEDLSSYARDGLTVGHNSRAGELRDLESRLANLTEERDTTWRDALESANQISAQYDKTAKARADEVVSRMRAQAEATIAERVEQKRAAVISVRDRCAYAPNPIVDVVSTSPRKAYLPSAADGADRLNRTAGDLTGEERRLLKLGISDARTFVCCLAKAQGLLVVFDPPARGDIPDRTQEFAREFGRRLAVTAGGQRRGRV